MGTRSCSGFPVVSGLFSVFFSVTAGVDGNPRGWDVHRTMAVQYGVLSAFVPCSVALFTCSCGASKVEADIRREVPDGWSTLELSHLCPRCSGDEGPGGDPNAAM